MFTQNKNDAISICLESVKLFGDLYLPSESKGLVLFAHGSGSSRFSTRNQYVAKHLNQLGIATLLFDLLTKEEESIDIYTREFRFNIPLLAKRLIDTTDWVVEQSYLSQLKIGYFGASTGAAAALIAAANRPRYIEAVVSRGGRPDLADTFLQRVEAPTLLIVGSEDTEVIKLNQIAQELMTRANTQLFLIPGATHLFEEPGTLDKVVEFASDWFLRFF